MTTNTKIEDRTDWNLFQQVDCVTGRVGYTLFNKGIITQSTTLCRFHSVNTGMSMLGKQL